MPNKPFSPPPHADAVEVHILPPYEHHHLSPHQIVMGVVPHMPVNMHMTKMAPPIVDDLHDYVTQLQIALSVCRQATHGEVTSSYDGLANHFQVGDQIIISVTHAQVSHKFALR